MAEAAGWTTELPAPGAGWDFQFLILVCCLILAEHMIPEVYIEELSPPPERGEYLPMSFRGKI